MAVAARGDTGGGERRETRGAKERERREAEVVQRHGDGDVAWCLVCWGPGDGLPQGSSRIRVGLGRSRWIMDDHARLDGKVEWNASKYIVL